MERDGKEAMGLVRLLEGNTTGTFVGRFRDIVGELWRIPVDDGVGLEAEKCGHRVGQRVLYLKD